MANTNTEEGCSGGACGIPQSGLGMEKMVVDVEEKLKCAKIDFKMFGYCMEKQAIVEELDDGKNKEMGLYCKNLIVKDKKGRMFLVVAPRHKDVDLNSLRKVIGAARCLSFVKKEKLRNLVMVESGTVSPFALANTDNQIELVLDEELVERGDVKLFFHPNHPAKAVLIDAKGLLQFMSLHCKHTPIWKTNLARPEDVIPIV